MDASYKKSFSIRYLISCDGNYGIGFIEGGTPKTDPSARPTDPENVEHAAVIMIKNGYFRGAWFDGTFELASAESPISLFLGRELRVKVKCHWHCHGLMDD